VRSRNRTLGSEDSAAASVVTAPRAARELVESADDAELFLYPGDQHYFADSSLPSYDADATKLLTQRVLEFLARVG